LRLVEKVRQGEEVIEGSLVYEETGQEIPIGGAVPYFSPEALRTNATARRFGFQWKRQAIGAFEKKTIYGESALEQLYDFAMNIVH